MNITTVLNQYEKHMDRILRSPKLTLKQLAGLAYYKGVHEKLMPLETEPPAEPQGFVQRTDIERFTALSFSTSKKKETK